MSDMKCPNIKIYKCSDGFVTDNAQVAKSHEANIKSNKLICSFCQQELDYLAEDIYGNMYCPNCRDKNGFTYKASESIWQELIRTRKALDKGMEHITGLNNMIESWYKLLQSDKDTSTKYAILKSAISAYVENKGGNNE